MRPAKVAAGQALKATGQLLHRTRSMAFTEGKVFDANGQLCAHATGTFKYMARHNTEASGSVPTD
jgi:acyl-coenzyme A thioesterase PaaI-like protein